MRLRPILRALGWLILIIGPVWDLLLLGASLWAVHMPHYLAAAAPMAALTLIKGIAVSAALGGSLILLCDVHAKLHPEV